MLDSFGIQKNSLQLRQLSTQKRIKSGQSILMQNKNKLLSSIKALGKNCIFTNNFAQMRQSYKKTSLDSCVESDLTNSVATLMQSIIGTKMVEINGIQCFARYEVDYEKRECHIELYHKLKPHPTVYVLENI